MPKHMNRKHPWTSSLSIQSSEQMIDDASHESRSIRVCTGPGFEDLEDLERTMSKARTPEPSFADDRFRRLSVIGKAQLALDGYA